MTADILQEKKLNTLTFSKTLWLSTPIPDIARSS